MERKADSIWGDTLILSVLVRRTRYAEAPTTVAMTRVRSRGLTPIRVLTTRESTDGTEVIVRAFEPLRG
jgi:hypothetical protein